MRNITKAAVVAALAVSAAGIGAGAASAATVPGAVHAVTHSAQHRDTTNVAVTATDPTTGLPGGSVWAYDNLSEQFTVTPEAAPGTYSVTIGVTGSFQGFADPIPGLAHASSGPVKGTIQYDVQSSTPPDPASLLPNQAPETGLGAAISQLFDGNSAITGGGDYTFSYQNGSYVQTSQPPFISGDVR